MTKPYKVIGNTKDISHEKWLEIRKKYIGGSDAGAIAGVNPWSSAATVWLDKMSDEIKDVDNERMRIGRDLEDYVAKRFAETTGKKVRRNNRMMVSVKNPFMLANIDREIVGENAILECKTTGSYSRGDWEDGEIPPHYYTQVQHYMAVTGADKGYIAVLIGNEQFTWYEIERDEEYIEALIQIEKDFYEQNMILGGFPTPDGSQAYSDAIRRKYSTATATEIELDDIQEDVERFVEVRDMIKQLEKEKKLYEQAIQVRMAQNETGLAGDRQITWKQVTSERFDTKKFKEEHPALAEEYTYSSETRRFSVK